MILYNHELKQSLKGLLIWMVCISGLFVFAMSMFPSFAQNPQMMNDFMEVMPTEIMDAFGLDGSDFSKPLDFMSYIFQYILLAAGAHAILIGGSIVAKEEHNKTIEFLYSKPVTRNYILTNKVFAGITNLVLINIVFTISSIAITNIVAENGVDNNVVLLMSLSMLMLQIMFFAIGLILSLLTSKNNKSMTSVGLGVLFATFFLGMVSGVNSSVSWLKYVAPIKYFDPPQLVQTGALQLKYVVIVMVIIVVCFIASFINYRRRDIEG